MVVRAVWRGLVVADSDDTLVVEGNHYFPAEAVRRDVLQPSSRRTVCPWKGVASYWSLVDGDRTSRDAAWTYPSPLPTARRVKGRIAFGPAVRVEHVPPPRPP